MVCLLINSFLRENFVTLKKVYKLADHVRSCTWSISHCYAGQINRLSWPSYTYYRERVDGGKLAFKFLLRDFDKLTKLNLPCNSDKCNRNELFHSSKIWLTETMLATVASKLYWNNEFCKIPADKTRSEIKKTLNLNNVSIKEIIFVTNVEITLKK